MNLSGLSVHISSFHVVTVQLNAQESERETFMRLLTEMDQIDELDHMDQHG